MDKRFINNLFVCFLLVGLFLPGVCFGEDSAAVSGGWPTVGIEAGIKATLPRGDLIAVGVKDRTDIILRVVSIEEKDGGFVYDLRYIGLFPGEFNLSKYLLLPDGSDPGELPAIPVKVLPLLPEGHQGELVSNKLKAYVPPGGYKVFFTIVWIFWGVLLIPLVFAFRKKMIVEEEKIVPPPTLEEMLRPLVEKALEGELDISGKEHLERLLMGYWQKELRLDKTDVYQMLRQIKEHPEGGKLLESLENWLHRPPGAGEVDIDELLSPYRNIAITPEKQEVA